jgi:hypothetical protein
VRVLTAYVSDEPGAAVTRVALAWCAISRRMAVQRYLTRVTVLSGLIAAGIMWKEGVAWWPAPLIGAALLKLWSVWMTPRWTWGMWAHEMLGGSGVPRPPFCPSCGYGLAGLSPAGDGFVECPECGAGWRVGRGE